MINQSVDKKVCTDKISQEGVDSKALLVYLIQYIPKLVLFALAGAILGSGLNLIIVALTELRNIEYIAETKYYIDFAEGRYEARDYYNDFTWNDEVISNDEILGKAMSDIDKNYGKVQDRNYIKEMITADILSDVRYLTIIVKDKDKELVSIVSEALQNSLEQFAANKDEFDSIYKVEDLGIKKEEIHFWTWRAAFLGAMVFGLLALFLRIFRFGIGDVFYTKSDVSRYLGLDVFGVLYEKGNEAEGIQEKMLIACLNKVISEKEKVYLLDVSGACYERFLSEITKLDSKNVLCSKFELISEENDNNSKDIILLIPFGMQIREKTGDIMACMEQLDYNILGAVLADVDKGFARLYYGE